MARQNCRRCGENRWHALRGQQVECLSCHLVAIDASGEPYAEPTKTINERGAKPAKVKS